MKSNINPKLFGGLLAALVLLSAPSLATGKGDSVGSLAASGKVKVESAGTGETIGHIADLKIQNLTDQPLTCAIPPMILESSSGQNQHYACPSGQSVALNPQQTKTVPMNGVCLNRNKPPVEKGVSGDLVMNEADPTAPQNPNAHLPATDANKLLRICTAKYEAAEQLQKSGALKNLPYHDPRKQKDIVVQWSTWTDPVICQMTGSPPATKEDLRKVVYKQVEEQGPMTPEKKKKVDQGIDTIFEKVELTSAKAKDLEKPDPFAQVKLTSEQGKGETPATGLAPTSGQTYEIGNPTPKPPSQPPTPTPCKEDLLALAMAKNLVDTAVAACRRFTTMDHAAGAAENAADLDDAAHPAAKAASDKADKAAADAKDAKAAADTAADKAKKAKGKDKAAAKADAKTKAEDAEAKAKDAEDAEDAKSPLRKKADTARAAADRAKKTRDDALTAAQDAINKLKCPDELNKKLKDACP